jgi:hypothetical protein
MIVVTAAVLVTIIVAGCEVGSGTITFSPPQGGILQWTLAGTVRGNITGNLSGSGVLQGPCPGSPGPGVAGSIMFADQNGSVTESECWSVSPPGTPLIFKGKYAVIGSTGIYQGATGNGTSLLSNAASGSDATLFEFGTFNLPVTASAASVRSDHSLRMHTNEYTFRMHIKVVGHPDRLLARLLLVRGQH